MSDTFKDIGAELDPLLSVRKKDKEDLVLWGLKGKLSTCGNMIKYFKVNLKSLRTEIKIDELLVPELDYNFMYYERPKINISIIPSF